jgi:glucose-6-phosphate dehydrogenase assembly protein OpcA
MSGTITETQEVKVDFPSIEKSLAELWRGENKDGEPAVTRAALWNVIAHTSNTAEHAHASQTLTKASESIPQRTIVIRAEPEAPSDMTSWISANCHLLDTKKQVCSEEVAIVAGGDRVRDVAPLVSALLIPDMPVAVWWVGDLPNECHAYVETLLDPADLFIFDSSFFDSPADIELVMKIARQTTTAPADLNWVRLEEWRVASASLFDPPAVRARLARIRKVRIVTGGDGTLFGDSIASLLYASWLSAQAGHEVRDDGTVVNAAGAIEYDFRIEGPKSSCSLSDVTIEFEDGSAANIRRDEERRILATSVDGITQTVEAVTRVLARGLDDLIVRQLSRVGADRVFIKVLPIAMKLAARVRK